MAVGVRQRGSRRLKALQRRHTLGHQLAQRRQQSVPLSCVEKRQQPAQLLHQLGARILRPLADPDLLGRGRNRGLESGDLLLGELLARPKTGEDDLHILARHPAGEADQLLGQVEDPHRLTHLQHGDGARGLRQRPRLKHQLSRLGDGHEVALHLRVGDGDGAARGELPLEQRDDAPLRGQHIAEAHGPEVGAGSVQVRQAEDDPLGDPLGRAHHARRLDRLVGGDQQHLGRRRSEPRSWPRAGCRARCCAPPRARWSPSAAHACRRRRG